MDSGESNLPLLLQHSYCRSKSITSDDLRNFRISLKWCALDHSSAFGKFFSYLAFTFLTIVVPAVTVLAVQDPGDDPISFNKLVQVPESGLAAVAFLSLCRFFRRYGLRQLLFLEGLQEDSVYVQKGYARELEKWFRSVAYILFPSFFVELAHKIIFFSTVKISFPVGFPINSILFIFVLGSWVYRTGVFLLVCVLFRLTCELQILRLQGVHKLFETSNGSESDSVLIFNEHLRIRKQLSITSHRYRFFIIVCLLVITVSQFVALLLVLASKADKNFFNSGDVVVCSTVQLCGFFLCLFGAARITHRAQGIASIATRWHMLVTSAASGSNSTKSPPLQPFVNHKKNNNNSSSGEDEDDTDSDSSSDVLISVRPQESSSFQTRQALVSYLQHNNGGITLFGYALDRGLLHTLFAFEFSLVMWILSKVVVLS
ncbi:hypothetical protein IC582_006274 [Cucumis melo]|uniref:Ras guanine nucleotide exchange factor K n=1 Tax=Cucumis melo var. makuwa TaxID=1194695 RepID=A0A5A7VCT9_CUCMM|nr:uncharacterized protein E6C27_scaffold82G003340 [Cucumis melo var. makuwa]